MGAERGRCAFVARSGRTEGVLSIGLHRPRLPAIGQTDLKDVPEAVAERALPGAEGAVM